MIEALSTHLILSSSNVKSNWSIGCPILKKLLIYFTFLGALAPMTNNTASCWPLLLVF